MNQFQKKFVTKESYQKVCDKINWNLKVSWANIHKKLKWNSHDNNYTGGNGFYADYKYTKFF